MTGSGTLQVTEEPNVAGNPTLDGYYPNVRDALVEGVLAADDEARRQGFDHLRIGFNTTPLFGPGEGFITALTERGGKEFTAALGYVGLDFFPDVFRPVPPPSAPTRTSPCATPTAIPPACSTTSAC